MTSAAIWPRPASDGRTQPYRAVACVRRHRRGNFLEGGHISALLNGPAALIVLGGTLGAVLLQTPIAVFMRAMSIGRWIFFPPRIDLARGILMVTHRATRHARRAARPGARRRDRARSVRAQRPATAGRRRRAEVIRSILEVDLYTRRAATCAPPRSTRAWAATRRPSESSVR